MNLFERTQIGKIRLHVLPTDRFKTFALTAFVGQPLSEDTVTSGAIIPHVLRRGNKKYPETRQFRTKLDDLYGAGFGFDLTKRGNYQVIQFRMDTINDRFVQASDSMLQQSIQYLGDTLTDPLIEDGAFRATYVEQEKQTVKRKIEAIINDKVRYAAERCVQEMCENDPYRLHPLGQLAQIDALQPDTLYQQYKDWLQRAQIDLYVVGDTNLKEVSQLVKQAFRLDFDSKNEANYEQAPFSSDKTDIKRVVDRLDVTQGKLNMGFRVHTTFSDELYPAALMYNGILGSYPHSKLFVNVREKASLAYYAASRLDGNKGIMTIQSGIEIDQVEQASAIILEQTEAMKQGEISDLEWTQTQAMLSNQLREISDSAYDMIGFDFNRIISKTERSTEDLITAIESVNKEQVQQFAQQVELDTIYFLRDREGAPTNADQNV